MRNETEVAANATEIQKNHESRDTAMASIGVFQECLLKYLYEDGLKFFSDNPHISFISLVPVDCLFSFKL